MRQPQTRLIPKISQRSSAIRKAFLFVLVVLGIGIASIRIGTPLLVDITNEKVSVTKALFPVGVDPLNKRIVENIDVDTYFKDHILVESSVPEQHTSWIRRILSRLALRSWYQNLASPSSRILVILPGERKEEVAEHFGNILGWNFEERREFMRQVASSSPELSEGKFTPYTYIATRKARPAEAAELVINRFKDETLNRYSSSTAAIVSLKDALTIASLLEREGRDFTDMREISGIIWNRLFIGMKLELDATLQYAKGSRVDQPWWPRVLPADKRIVSAFNTYRNGGLPPAPIANSSVAAILAALNPKSTDCMFYFHDAKGEFHCSVTYKEHVTLLRQYY